MWWYEKSFIDDGSKKIFFNLGRSCLWLFFYFHSLCFLKICSRRKTSNYLCHLYSWSKRGKTISDIFFIGTFFLIFFLLEKKMDPKIIKVFSEKRNASSPDDEFKFQPKHERSDRRHESFRFGPRVREDVTLVAFSGEEERRFHHRSPSSTFFKNF